MAPRYRSLASERVRRFSLALVIIIGAGVLAWSLRHRGPAAEPARFAWVATAHQFGPVGYRDPAGAISPDGKWIAYSEGRFLRVRSVDGGPAIDLPAGDAQIRHVSWRADNRTILADGSHAQADWAIYDVVARTRKEFAPGDVVRTFQVRDGAAGDPERVDRDPKRVALQMLVWSPDGQKIAGIVNAIEGQELRIIAADGAPLRSQAIASRISFPAWTPGGEVACIATVDGRSRVTIPCGGRPVRTDPDLDAYGPIAFAPNGQTVYVGMPSDRGTLDLRAVSIDGGRARQLTSFSRDAYAPTVAADGTVLFKVQSYRTVVALVPATGGVVGPLSTFQSETPSWDPSGSAIGITYGSWRRVVDDAHYPDIAQDAGIIGADVAHPAVAPRSVVEASASEDQSLCWSPNGRWLAFHSHKDQSDDIWLRASTGEATARRVTFLGRGAETGWPRWSPDGRWGLFSAASRSTHRTAIYAFGVNQDSGSVTSQAREVAVRGIQGDVTHAEWLPESAEFVAIGKEAPGRHIIITAPREGGDARVVRRFASEHDAPGLAVAPDGRDVAFIAPAADGFFQVFRMPLAGGEPV